MKYYTKLLFAEERTCQQPHEGLVYLHAELLIMYHDHLYSSVDEQDLASLLAPFLATKLVQRACSLLHQHYLTAGICGQDCNDPRLAQLPGSAPIQTSPGYSSRATISRSHVGPRLRHVADCASVPSDPQIFNELVGQLLPFCIRLHITKNTIQKGLIGLISQLFATASGLRQPGVCPCNRLLLVC